MSKIRNSFLLTAQFQARRKCFTPVGLLRLLGSIYHIVFIESMTLSAQKHKVAKRHVDFFCIVGYNYLT